MGFPIGYTDLFPCDVSMPKMNIYTCKFTGKKMFSNLPNVINEKFKLKNWWRNKFRPVREISFSGFSKSFTFEYDGTRVGRMNRSVCTNGRVPDHYYVRKTNEILPHHVGPETFQ